MAGPRIITARSIGLQFRSNHGNMEPIREVTGHYSATPRAGDWRAGIRSAQSFHRSHLGRGWAGIGYHYLIPDDGAIICCRPVIWKGAHVLGINDGRVGVNMPGTRGDRPTRMQAGAFRWLLENAHTDRFPRIHRANRKLAGLPIHGHFELPGQSTSCPGLFLWMFKHEGLPWQEELDFDPDTASPDDLYVGPTEDEADVPEADPATDAQYTGPDEEEAEADVDPSDQGELPEADDEFDEDLSGVVETRAY